MRNIYRIILMIVGTISLILGIIGALLPVLPTTPFILLTAGCYIRSSDKLYTRLINNRWGGEIVRNYSINRSIPLRAKVISITILWLSILSSVIFILQNYIIRIFLLVISVSVTIYIMSFETTKN